MSGFSLCPLRYGGRLLGGGVIDDHRGVGMRLAPYMGDQFGPAGMALMRAIKGALDPGHLLCRGKLGLAAAE